MERQESVLSVCSCCPASYTVEPVSFPLTIPKIALNGNIFRSRYGKNEGNTLASFSPYWF